jgi:plastocyanin
VKKLVIVGAIVAGLAAAGQASAAKYQVFLGEQQRPPAGTPKGTTLNQFLPKAITINAGDSVTYSSATFHTVTYAPRPPALLGRDPAKGKYEGQVDAAGEPFWYEGLPKLIYNPPAFGPFGPKTVSGATPTSSGVLSPAGPKAKPVTFTYSFPKAGSYKLFCTVHPGMTATVVVKPAGTPVPKTPAQVQAQALTDTNAAWQKAKVLAAAAKPPANTVDMGVGADTTLLAYFPKSLTVKAGTTVTFVNRSAPEVHNVVFGPKKYIRQLQTKTDLFPMGPNSPNQVAPALAYGSEPKGKYTYDGKNHGNGFLSTPVTIGAASVPLPHASRVTFTTPGTYKYFCWIHGPDMGGTIVVTK